LLFALIFLSQLPFSGSAVSAACEKGSDDSCKRFGDNFCCAYIDIKSDKDQLRGYYCSDVKYSGDDYDYAGYKGSIICSAGYAISVAMTFLSALIFVVIF
jgi:hypothetical protein